MVQHVQDVELVPGRDKVSWHLEQSGKFSVKSMYASLSLGATVAHFKDMWETNLPLKIKIFSWQLALDKFPPNNRLLFDMARQMDVALFVEAWRMPIICFFVFPCLLCLVSSAAVALVQLAPCKLCPISCNSILFYGSQTSDSKGSLPSAIVGFVDYS
jgi:hypothetical protein